MKITKYITYFGIHNKYDSYQELTIYLFDLTLQQN